MSENALGGGNQQERREIIGWVVGFTDGEGCFSVTIFRNAKSRLRLGWQVMPEFVVTQSVRSLDALRMLQKFFGCGSIFRNRRYDNHREDIYRYCVRSVRGLKMCIVPFFQKHQLRTNKQKDFLKFVQILELMEKGAHLKIQGLSRIARIAQTMNRQRPSKFLESSETIRRTRPSLRSKI